MSEINIKGMDIGEINNKIKKHNKNIRMNKVELKKNKELLAMAKKRGIGLIKKELKTEAEERKHAEERKLRKSNNYNVFY